LHTGYFCQVRRQFYGAPLRRRIIGKHGSETVENFDAVNNVEMIAWHMDLMPYKRCRFHLENSAAPYILSMYGVRSVPASFIPPCRPTVVTNEATQIAQAMTATKLPEGLFAE